MDFFMTRQDCADNLWKHALLFTASCDHSITGSVLQVNAVTHGMGVFIHRIADGLVNIVSANASLELQTVPYLANNYQVFEIKMLNVPQGNFLIGDKTRSSSNYGFSYANPYAPILITNAIQTAGIDTASNYRVNNWGLTGALQATYPHGL